MNLGTPPPLRANIGKGSPSYPSSKQRETYNTVTTVGDYYHTWGYNVAIITPSGEIEVQQIGKPGNTVGLSKNIPVWTESNPYGMKPNTPIKFDRDNNVLNDKGQVIVPFLDGLNGEETLYSPNDKNSEGTKRRINVSDKDVGNGIIIRSERIISKGNSQKIKHKNITKDVKEANT